MKRSAGFQDRPQSVAATNKPLNKVGEPKRATKRSTKRAGGRHLGNQPNASDAVKPQTKKAQLIAMLTSKVGATVEQISSKLQWQSHSTRAALTGLRKAGYEIDLEKPDGGGAGIYRIIKPARSSK